MTRPIIRATRATGQTNWPIARVNRTTSPSTRRTGHLSRAGGHLWWPVGQVGWTVGRLGWMGGHLTRPLLAHKYSLQSHAHKMDYSP